MAAFAEDVEDIQVVADYLIRNFGYVIDLIVGHSKGSVAAMRWVCISPQAANVRGFVDVSGGYRLHVRYSNFTLGVTSLIREISSSHLVRQKPEFIIYRGLSLIKISNRSQRAV